MIGVMIGEGGVAEGGQVAGPRGAALPMQVTRLCPRSKGFLIPLCPVSFFPWKVVSHLSPSKNRLDEDCLLVWSRLMGVEWWYRCYEESPEGYKGNYI